MIVPSHTIKDPSTMRHSFDNDVILGTGSADGDKYNGDEEGTLSHRKLVQPGEEEAKNDYITPLKYDT